MNVNIVLDSEYICNKLSEGKEDQINFLFTFIKNSSNIILLQDNEKNILKNIIKHKKIGEQNIKNVEIFLTALINGTNKYEFFIEEKYENDFQNFIKIIKDKNYPLQMIISDKKIDENIKTYKIEDIDGIIENIKKYTERYIISDNEELLKGKDVTNVVSFDEYESILLNTFWCSSKITIVGREFFDGSVISNHKSKNVQVYTEGLNFLNKVFKKIKDFTGKKVEIEIITGVPGKKIDKFKMNSRSYADEAYEILKEIDDNFKLTIVKWDIGDEIKVGEGHGRRIYSDYGGFDTGFMPFDLFTNEMRFKDSSFHWITEKEHINPLSFMNLLAKRPN